MSIIVKQSLRGKTNVGNVIYGKDGVTFTPTVDDEGNLSWTNNGELDNPETVNIKGPKGDKGIQGEQGEQGPKGDDGAPGEPGKSAYEYAKEAGYTGTEEEFAEKLAAPSGGGTASAIPDDEMLDFLMEMDIVQPLSNTNNAVYTDSNNNLYVL